MSKKALIWLFLAAGSAACASASCASADSGAETTGTGGTSSAATTTSEPEGGTSTTAAGGASAGGQGGTTTTTSASGGAGTGSGGTGSGGTGSGGAGTGSGGASTGSGGAGGSAPVGARMVINEVVADPAAGSDWIELYNAGDTAADLTGWTMTDSDPTHVFAFAAGTQVAAGAYLTFDQNVAGSFTYGLGKSGDAVSLYDAQAALVDHTEWVSPQADAPTSWGRLPNGSGAFQTLATPTEGAENQ